jgi:hypothetical protein
MWSAARPWVQLSSAKGAEKRCSYNEVEISVLYGRLQRVNCKSAAVKRRLYV